MNSLEDVVALRLRNQHLIGEKFGRPEDVVKWLGAVQAQDYPAVKWAVGIRVEGATDEVVERAYNEGKFLRVHMMRPTWHLVAPEDLRWIQKLTSPRVLAMNAHMCRKLELDERVLGKCHEVIEKALEGKNFLTREEISQALEAKKIQAKGQRLAYIVMEAELQALICNGPRRGKQFTYGLVEDVVPRAKERDREEALVELARRYVRSHGPVQVRDFAWWSGLAKKDVEVAFGLAELERVDVEGKEYWVMRGGEVEFGASTNGHGNAKSDHNPDSGQARKTTRTFYDSPTRSAFLLSIYDEYTIAYNDRSGLGGDKVAERLLRMGNALTAVVVLDGKIVGTWKRKIGKKKVEVTLDVFEKVGGGDEKLIDEAVERYRKFVFGKDIV